MFSFYSVVVTTYSALFLNSYRSPPKVRRVLMRQHAHILPVSLVMRVLPIMYCLVLDHLPDDWFNQRRDWSKLYCATQQRLFWLLQWDWRGWRWGSPWDGWCQTATWELPNLSSGAISLLLWCVCASWVSEFYCCLALFWLDYIVQ